MQAWRPATLSWRDSKHSCFPANIEKIFMNSFYYRTPPVAASVSWPEPMLVCPLNVFISNFEQVFNNWVWKSFESSNVLQRQLIRYFTEQMFSKNSQTFGESNHKEPLIIFSRAFKLTQLTFTCSKPATETLEKCVKYTQS